jgi:hypothetical protein
MYIMYSTPEYTELDQSHPNAEAEEDQSQEYREIITRGGGYVLPEVNGAKHARNTTCPILFRSSGLHFQVIHKGWDSLVNM